MKVDPHHLEILAAIVDNGGLTEGAHALGKSQPSVSRSLGLFEDRLGVSLFVPGRRPLQPTDFCLALAQEGRKIVEAGRSSARLIAQYKSGQSGAVRVSGSPIFMDGVVMPVIAAFQSEFPDVQINQGYGYAQDVLNTLQNDTLDLGIVPIRDADVPEGIEAHQILPGRNVIACRIGHPLARKSTVRLSDIAQFPWIAPPPDSPLHHDLRAVLDGIGVTDFKVSFSGGSLASVTNVLANSDALTVLPYSVVFMLRRQNTMTTLSIRIGDPDRNLCMLTARSATPRPAIERFARFVKSEFVAMSKLILHHEQNTLWRT
jgi:DNA-binding transcriptional LysR family regulator